MTKKNSTNTPLSDFVIVFALAVLLRMLIGIVYGLSPAATNPYIDYTRAALLAEMHAFENVASASMAQIANDILHAINDALGGNVAGRFKAFLPSVNLTAQHVALRLLTLAGTWSFALIALVVGFTNGITTRHLRRVRVEPESALLFTRSRSMLALPLACFFFYLCVPIQLPIYTIAVIAWAVVGGMLWVNIGYMSKRL